MHIRFASRFLLQRANGTTVKSAFGSINSFAWSVKSVSTSFEVFLFKDQNWTIIIYPATCENSSASLKFTGILSAVLGSNICQYLCKHYDIYYDYVCGYWPAFANPRLSAPGIQAFELCNNYCLFGCVPRCLKKWVTLSAKRKAAQLAHCTEFMQLSIMLIFGCIPKRPQK